MNVVKLLQGGGLIFIAQALVWFQMYGPLRIEWLKGNHWFIYGSAIPITYLFVLAIRLCTEAFGGDMYPSRFLTFTLGVVSFAVLTWYFNGEGINMKTAVSLILALSIILIQIFWK
jgi:hypothetical protein